MQITKNNIILHGEKYRNLLKLKYLWEDRTNKHFTYSL